jgi:outer membrane protein OmpA-like peptidoglycan-associated protein
LPQAAAARACNSAWVVAVLCAALAGCGQSGDEDTGPIAWWHNLEGGPIAAQRPPPPGLQAPYPHLASVPAKPKPFDPKAQAATYNALAADRADATYQAKLDPLVPAAPQAANGLFAPAKPLPPASPDAAGAALDAAMPAKIAAAAAPAAGPPKSPADVPIPDIVADNTPPPPIPAAPPLLPHLAGVEIPVTPFTPPSAPPPPPVKPGVLTAAEAAPTSIAFPPGSAVLDKTGQDVVQKIAFRRGTHQIEIVGFGESDGQDPQSQYQGVELGLERARAIAAALEGWTVPLSAMHLAAQAPGRGAAVRLVD